ncbi:sn-glycerol-3-phosphate ABC transporter ATP-binding protein UgpC [Thioalkalicoccus limnaeus]|uniref:Sn-glycerol-3-phosphate ABC transporter ATP-binding protein UgpC n=1 Tax=Thioalkalicoccus limnaeus TaxID=120681 RepID=A0ABV4BHT4_9GAMM
MASVAFDRVVKRFGAHTVIEDLTLEIEDGEWLVLLGPSGCGKSTLLRMLAGLEDLSAGEIRLDGRVVNRLGPPQRNVAMVFQNYALYPHMTVRENLAFPLRMRRLRRVDRDERIQAAADMLGLGGLLERKPAELSGGQRQRVAMGRAIVREPSVFLMDEPLSNLDARLRAQIRMQIAELQQQLRTTTLYVTHDQVEAMTLGQRVAVMDQGRLQQVAAPLELYQRPANLFVAGFLGNPPMNRWVVQLRADDDRFELGLAGQWIPLPGPPPAEAQYVGLRPEALVPPAPGAPRIRVRVDAVEALGYETLIHFADRQGLDDGAMTARWPTGVELARTGDLVELAPDLAALHWFDRDGRRIAGDGRS